MKNFTFFIVFYVIKNPSNFHMIEMVNHVAFLIFSFEFWRENGVILLQTMMSPFPTY